MSTKLDSPPHLGDDPRLVPLWFGIAALAVSVVAVLLATVALGLALRTAPPPPHKAAYSPHAVVQAAPPTRGPLHL